eukprot:TRINITY_DN1321_c0_g1_i1.p1 TRINITY_DN1321_c0_g1~~TRINITY_DN1321_c0_g1_i1.p1  ORF type:complete len:599 (-),score=162.06 TRINITY_DN1321_c0_g1_i1:64-1860(-)
MSKVLVFALLVALASADLYLHSHRGSNNRNRETNGNVNNNNRLFNSQNNNAGGYCWGPSMFFYVGSQLRIEWTSQHGCGQGNDKVHCQLIIQYMVDPGEQGYEVRDGTTTDQIPDDALTYNTPAVDDPAGETFLYGMHESYFYYQNCTARERNKGLYIADQNVGNNARHTRQNAGGGRRGFECQEERDYYPYWHPSPWKDIVVFTDDISKCPWYEAESQNVKDRNLCSEAQYNNQQECLSNGGTWDVYPAWGIAAPLCLPAPVQRDNHLGNAAMIDADGNPVTAYFDWTVPNDVTPKAVLRLRYNMSSADFDPWTTDSTKNGESAPLKQDPYINVHPDPNEIFNVSLAVDTDQFARTFQDRTHTFEIRKVPNGSGFPADGARIFNLNVRGKRGNIVQTYPSTEYDFVPTHLALRTGDWVHFQWTGCDTNPANNDGEGTASTDRSNIVQIGSLTHSTPMLNPDDFNSKWLFNNDEVRLRFANLDQTNCLTYEELLAKHGAVNNNFEQDVQNCMKLNAAEPYFDGGLIQMNRAGNFHYMSSRNNNFSNRGQKATIAVSTLVPTWSIVVLSVGGALFASAIVLVILKVASSSNPTLASYFG